MAAKTGEVEQVFSRMGFIDALRAADYTIDELAEALGIAPSTVGYWLAGTSRPRPNMLANIARLLSVGVNDLMEEV